MWSWGIICALRPVNSGENTDPWVMNLCGLSMRGRGMDGRVVMFLSKMYRSHYLIHTLSLAPVRPDVLNVFLLAQSSHLDNLDCQELPPGNSWWFWTWIIITVQPETTFTLSHKWSHVCKCTLIQSCYQFFFFFFRKRKNFDPLGSSNKTLSRSGLRYACSGSAMSLSSCTWLCNNITANGVCLYL